jgi:hypothetical protein
MALPAPNDLQRLADDHVGKGSIEAHHVCASSREDVEVTGIIQSRDGGSHLPAAEARFAAFRRDFGAF